ncbi:uncharacterized protein LOC124125871 [Haliotis rufescens]|uniref:uncharacterized protein LOC124125871 n=1 Tax=Haliotis rufescens TaxID=6454 RepID=UPI00201EFA2E|nr:uncharacterized protein LOC124125871 [Haliotis rufescens]
MAASEGGWRTGHKAQPPDEKRTKMQEDCYKMDSEPRGLCYIFNNKRFEGRKLRIGTEKDRDLLRKVWKTLQFEVKTFDDLKKQEMEEKLQELARLDVHKDNDCVVVFFLTHGDNGTVQGSDNEWLTIDSIISPFKAANCPLLAGKPKLFFFQSCRGKQDQKVQFNVDGGKTPVPTEIKVEIDKMALTEGDFFFGFPTVAGTKARRNEENGSWFIQELVQTLQESADREDLESLMTTTRRRVNKHRCETADGTSIMQTAESKTTLFKKVYFKGKVSRKANCSTGQSELDNLVSDALNLIKQADSNKHVSTNGERSAYNLIQQQGSVFIKGKSGSGKSTLGLTILARVSRETSRSPVVLSSWNEWNLIPKVNHENHQGDESTEQKKYVVLIDDIFGSSNLVESDVNIWVKLFDRLWQNVESGHVWLVITSRSEICLQCDAKIRKYKLIKTIQCMVLDEGEYVFTPGEKLEMIEKICGDKFFNHHERNDIVRMTTVLGFPQCCTFFASSKEAQSKGKEFFKRPHEFVSEEITRMQECDGIGHLVLLLTLMKDGNLSSDQLKPSTYKEELASTVEYLKECCNISTVVTAAHIKSKIEDFCGVYLVKTGKIYQFQHQSIHDVVFINISKREPEIAIRNCPPKMLVELMHTKQMNESDLAVILARDDYHILADKITDLLLSKSYSDILDHPSLRHEEFVKFLVESWRENMKLTEVIQKKHEVKCVKWDVPSSEGDDDLDSSFGFYHYSLTLFNYTSLISDVILQGLMLLLNDILSDVCHKVDTTELLAPALYIQDNQLVQKLLDKCRTDLSDCFLALCVSPAIDQDIKERLTQNITSEIPQPYDVLLVTVLVGNKYLVKHILQYLKNDKDIVSRCQEILKLSLLHQGCNCLSSSPNTCQDSTIMCTILHMLISLIPANCPLQDITDGKGNTLLHLAVQTGNLYYTNVFLNEQNSQHLPLDPQCVHWLNTDGSTPLHLAAGNESCEIVKRLLDEGACVSTQNKDGDTPLHQAASWGHTKTVKLLLDEKAYVSTPNKDGDTPLHLAPPRGQSETVKLLLNKGAGVCTQNKDGDTPLHMVAKWGQIETVKLLLDNAADVSTQNKDDDTPLHLAGSRGHSETVKLLLDKKAEVSTQNKDGNTPLHLAASRGHSETVKLLLEKEADVSAQNKEGNTPLHLAAHWGHSEAVKLLLDKKADVSTQNKDGNTPLHLAASRGHSETVKLLLEKEADVSAQNKDGNTPLHLAAHWGHSEAVKLLLDKKADVSAQNKDGNTPLHLAASRGHSETVKLLLEKEADVSAQNKDGNTPLHLAAPWGHSEAVKLLLDKAVDVSTQNRDGDTPLHLAASRGYSETVKLLLDKKGHVYTQNRDGDTPLHLAAPWGHSEAVKLLLDKKADVSTQNKDGDTPLHLAASRGHSETVKLLLEKEADVSSPNKDGNTPLHLAAPWGHSEAVKLLLDKAVDVSTQNKDGDTPLHLASSRGHSETVKLLLDEKAYVSTPNKDGDTPLHLAASRGHSETVKLLLDKKADVSTQNKDGNTPLHLAASRGHSETVKLLLDKKAHVSTQNRDGDTPLHLAASRGHSEAVKLLLDKKADVSAQNKDGDTPLHLAALWGHSEAVKLLLDKKADVSTQNRDGYTPLHLAASRGHSETVKLLLDKKAHVSTQNKDGDTPLHLAAPWGHSEAVKLLLDKKADVSAQNKDGDTPLHLAASRGHSETVKLLLDKKADVSTQNKDGDTPLHLAARWGHSEAVKLLLDKKADVSAQNKDGDTPLHLAASRGHSETVKLLLDKKAHVSTQNRDGDTPLHLAARWGHSEAVKLLLDKKADVSAQNKDGDTPLHLAARWGHSEAVKLLLDKKADVSTQNRDGYTPLHLAQSRGHGETVKLLLVK